MRKDLIDRIGFVCPACSWAGGDSVTLELAIEKEVDGDVLSGHLSCGACPRRYPILEGVAVRQAREKVVRSCVMLAFPRLREIHGQSLSFDRVTNRTQ